MNHHPTPCINLADRSRLVIPPRKPPEQFRPSTENGNPMKITFNDMPFAECPHCGHKWQVEDYYELEDGSELECPECDRHIVVLSVDHTMSVRLGASCCRTEADEGGDGDG